MSSLEYLFKLIGKAVLWLVIIPVGIVLAIFNEGSPQTCTATAESFLKPGTPVPYWIAKPLNVNAICVDKERTDVR